MPYPFAREHGNRTTQPMSNGRRVVVALGLIAGVGAAAPASAQQAKQQGAQHPAATVEIRGQESVPGKVGSRIEGVRESSALVAATTAMNRLRFMASPFVRYLSAEDVRCWTRQRKMLEHRWSSRLVPRRSSLQPRSSRSRLRFSWSSGSRTPSARRCGGVRSTRYGSHSSPQTFRAARRRVICRHNSSLHAARSIDSSPATPCRSVASDFSQAREEAIRILHTEQQAVVAPRWDVRDAMAVGEIE